MKCLVYITALTLWTGCFSTRVETDFGGQGDFIVHNKSSMVIRVEIKKVSQLGGGNGTSLAINPDSSLKILSDNIIGSNVTPKTTIQNLKIYKDSSGNLIEIYTQDPVNESDWIIEKQYTGDFGNTVNTFVFSDSLIKR